MIEFFSIKYPHPDTLKWVEEDIEDFALTESEYQIFLRGYRPDWDSRYAPVLFDGWHYITRSGFWLKKFKYEKQKDNLYHITQYFSIPQELNCPLNLLELVFAEGYFRPSLVDVAKRTIKRG